MRTTSLLLVFLAASCATGWREHALRGADIALGALKAADAIAAPIVRTRCVVVSERCAGIPCPALDDCHRLENRLLAIIRACTESLNVVFLAIKVNDEAGAVSALMTAGAHVKELQRLVGEIVH